MMKDLLKSNKGMALIFVMLIGVIVIIAGGTLWQVSNADARDVKKDENNAQAYAYAQSGLELAVGNIMNNGKDYLADDMDNLHDFYGSLDGSSFGTAPEDPEVHNIKFTIERKSDPGDEKGDYFLIDSTGYVRDGGSSVVSQSTTKFKIYVHELFPPISGGNNDNNGGNQGGNDDIDNSTDNDLGPLDMIFASDGLTMKNSAKIQGNFGTNVTKYNEGKINIHDSNQIKGNMYIGYGGNLKDWDDAKKYAEGTISNLERIRDYPLPDFPNPPYPSNTSKKAVTDKISESGNYENIILGNSETLTFEIGNNDLIIQTSKLELGNSAKIILNKSGSDSGRLILHVTDSLTMDNSSCINEIPDINSDGINDIYMFYSGTEKINLKNSTKFFGSVYVEKANIEIDNSSNLSGNVITGGSSVELKNSSNTNVRAVYAPKANVIFDNSSKFEGALVAKSIDMKNSAVITYNDSINTNFFEYIKRLNDQPEPTPNYEGWRGKSAIVN